MIYIMQIIIMYLFITRRADYPQRPHRNPHITTVQISTASLGCKVAKLRGQMGLILNVSILWEGCVSYKIWQPDNLGIGYIDVIIHKMRFRPYKLQEFYRRWM